MRLTVGGLLLFSSVSAFAQGSTTRLIAVDPALSALVREAARRSPTFRALLHEVEANDWIVFVQPGACPDLAAVGCLLHTVGNFEGKPYLRLLVNPRGRHPDSVMMILAHELQHAVEVVTSGTVTNTSTMLELQRRIASSQSRGTRALLFETAAARKVGETVFRELRQR
jgi:hypothetical protein